MNIREVAKTLGLSNDGTYYRMSKLGMDKKEDYFQDDIDKIVLYMQEKRLPQSKVSDIEIYEYWRTQKVNDLNTMSKHFSISYNTLNHRLNRIFRDKYLIVESKLNSM